MAVLAILIYVIVRLFLFLSPEYTLIERGSSLLLILAELFILVHGLGYVINVIKVYTKKKNKVADNDEIRGTEAGRDVLKDQPSVAVLVAARHEPKNVLEETFRAIKGLNYKNKSVYFLDDSSDNKYKKEAEELARNLDLILFRRETRHGAKAGIINDCLKDLDQKYIVIFDADQNPLPEFLNILAPLMEKN